MATVDELVAAWFGRGDSADGRATAGAADRVGLERARSGRGLGGLEHADHAE